MEEELAVTQRLVIPRAAGQVLRDVGVDEPSSIGFEVHIGVANIRFSFAQSLYFRAVQHHPGFQPFQDVIVIRGRSVLRDDLFTFALGLLDRLGHSRSS